MPTIVTFHEILVINRDWRLMKKTIYLGRISNPNYITQLRFHFAGKMLKITLVFFRFACLMLGNIFSQMVVLRWWFTMVQFVTKTQNESKLKNP